MTTQKAISNAHDVFNFWQGYRVCILHNFFCQTFCVILPLFPGRHKVRCAIFGGEYFLLLGRGAYNPLVY